MRVYAELIVSAVCEVVVRRGKGLELEDVVELPGEARGGVEMGGVVASLHPCFEAEINYRLRPEVTTVGEGMVDSSW
ncbi:hypothetical protein [Actinosynnema sp. ALI-1.44]|uniref:hypothetical protein n=1 Tax=Actinosynnema sp. ALI-1.44 TaxID=1933779 RepID=UPI00097C5FF2|nr:hypothetical protein [Actinosynnema sp. ALI-1.44]